MNPGRKIMRHAHVRKHVSPKIRRSLRLYLGICVVLLGFVVHDVMQGNAQLSYVATGLLAGSISGAILSRMKKVSWHEETGMATNAMDGIGVVFLILYIVFEIFRENLVELFIQGPVVASVSLALLAGSFYGRVIGDLRSVKKILKLQGVFEDANNQ